ncbi:lytic transglycosylase domain-containing protein [Mesorhizobium sp. USDA-HM6]|nr:lytic transglycosylase domain-containing protein [Mesorhizobium sp. USDA-HM6]
MFARRLSAIHSGQSVLLRATVGSVLALLRGLCISCVICASALAQGPSVVTSAARNYEAAIAEAAKRFRLPAAWIRAVLGVESAGDQRATSRKGAMGLMQIVPETWSELRARYSLGRDPYNPRDNIIAGSAYIRELMDRYGSPGWIAAYNAGPGRYEASLQGRRLPHETRAYVAAVASAIGSSRAGKPFPPGVATSRGWRRAPLFATRSDGSATDQSMPLARPRTDTVTAGPVHGLFDVVAPSIGLFVPKANERTAP